MASVRPISGQRGIRQHPNTEFPYHPTLLEVAQRQQELDVWETLQVGGYGFAKPGTIISFLISAVMLFFALSPIPPN